jgi:hypothetical protein
MHELFGKLIVVFKWCLSGQVNRPKTQRLTSDLYSRQAQTRMFYCDLATTPLL